MADFPRYPLSYPLATDIKETLAICGGRPVIDKAGRKTTFPSITKEDCYQILVSLKNVNREHVEPERFAEEYRKYVGANYAIPTASGTSSLHLALAGAGIQPGDEVVVPAFTFIATAMAVLQVKAIPRFVDIDPRTFTLLPADVEKNLTSAVTAVLPVHTHGLPADMPALRSICEKHGLQLVEDASHAHSADINSQYCGAMGIAAGQSLMADKNFPVGGEGGIAFFKDERSYQRAVAYLEKNGLEYRMSWVVAVFGRSQLNRLSYYNAIRQRNAKLLSSRLSQIPGFIPPYVPSGYTHSYNMYRITIDPQAMGIDKDISVGRVRVAIQQILNAEGIAVREWQNCPLPFHPPFRERYGFGAGIPWSLSPNSARDYALEHFPNTLSMLESSLVLCRELRSPIELERIEHYITAFEKVIDHRDEVVKLARSLDYQPPWEQTPRLG